MAQPLRACGSRQSVAAPSVVSKAIDARKAIEAMKIYLAGPLFSTAERDFNARLAQRLRDLGHEIWLPQESEQATMTPAQIFKEDVAGIDWAEVVVANMDGPDPDSGTCWECGYAYCKKPVVVFRTDFRVGYDVLPVSAATHPGVPDQQAPYNLMLTESATLRLDLVSSSIDEVASRINAALATLSVPGFPAAPHSAT
jgi:nucleoside 2-deoxyribosyltransferase